MGNNYRGGHSFLVKMELHFALIKGIPTACYIKKKGEFQNLLVNFFVIF